MNEAGQVETLEQGSSWEGGMSERGLWTAVLLKAVEDWRSGTLRARQEAADFLFNDEKDFETVCTAAGLNPQYLRAKLARTTPPQSAASLLQQHPVGEPLSMGWRGPPVEPLLAPGHRRKPLSAPASTVPTF
jgi:hypothetical protein